MLAPPPRSPMWWAYDLNKVQLIFELFILLFPLLSILLLLVYNDFISISFMLGPISPSVTDYAYMINSFRTFGSTVAANLHWYERHWCNIPIWQLPDDLLLLQELISTNRPSLIIETGTKFGGSAAFFASIFSVLSLNESRIVTIDINPTDSATKVCSASQWAPFIQAQIVASATDPAVVEHVSNVVQELRARPHGPIFLFLDDWHDGDHVFQELELYTPFLREGDMLIVSDTIFADLAGSPVAPHSSLLHSNPRTALDNFLALNHRFERLVLAPIGLSNFPDGICRCIANP